MHSRNSQHDCYSRNELLINYVNRHKCVILIIKGNDGDVLPLKLGLFYAKNASIVMIGPLIAQVTMTWYDVICEHLPAASRASHKSTNIYSNMMFFEIAP